MSEPNGASADLPDRTVPPTTDPETSEKGPSKSALKKAAKDKEKAEKAAKRLAAEEAQKKQSEANDVSAEDYGELPMIGSQPYIPNAEGAKRVRLEDVARSHGNGGEGVEKGKEIVFRGVVENARNQSAKLSFLVFRQGMSTIQAVVAASEQLSRQMVKFAGSLPAESVVLVHALVETPKEPVKSTTIQNLEVHVKKLYLIAKADAQLPMQVADSERPVPEENTSTNTTNSAEEQKDSETHPIVTLNTRLNNRVIDLRGKHNQAIFRIKDGVQLLFTEYLRNQGFVGVNTPRLLGAASEGGANVFEVSYFATKAFLAQSPQLYKQMLIASRFERVMEIGPIFRAENSNTARHLTEFTGLDLEMAFEEDYHEVVTLLEELMLYIFHGLRERYSRETDLVRSVYPVSYTHLTLPTIRLV